MQRIFYSLLVLLILPALVWGEESIPETEFDDYTIGPGDAIEISVWKNPDLTRLVTVLPGGKISFPLIGDLVAAQKTVAALRKELITKLSAFINEPLVSVMVQRVNSMEIYVIGKVNRPGRFSLNTDIDVLQALAMAGGMGTYAKRNKIKIFRKHKQGTTIFQFKYDDVSEGRDLEQNIVLQRGDVIVVP